MRVNFGVKWWELDPTYSVIWTLDKVGVIKLKRKVAKRVAIPA